MSPTAETQSTLPSERRPKAVPRAEPRGSRSCGSAGQGFARPIKSKRKKNGEEKVAFPGGFRGNSLLFSRLFCKKSGYHRQNEVHPCLPGRRGSPVLRNGTMDVLKDGLGPLTLNQARQTLL